MLLLLVGSGVARVRRCTLVQPKVKRFLEFEFASIHAAGYHSTWQVLLAGCFGKAS
jgi:hypothetical protein